jgi:hypothetical protein
MENQARSVILKRGCRVAVATAFVAVSMAVTATCELTAVAARLTSASEIGPLDRT